jgi:hypothetical protein
MRKGQQRIGFVRTRMPAVEIEALPASEDSSSGRMLHHNLAMDKLSKADRPQDIDRPHTLSARFIQRLYANLLTLSPKLEYDDTRKQWNAVWG